MATKPLIDDVPQDETTPQDETEPKEESNQENQAKVPEQFQKEVMGIVESCTTIAQLDFMQAEVSEMRQKLMSSQKKAGLNTDNFSTADMPKG
jgi:hypothetical protein